MGTSKWGIKNSLEDVGAQTGDGGLILGTGNERVEIEHENSARAESD